MAVYVDDPVWRFGKMHMCHMMADTIEELHEMAEKIGMQRKWYQPKSTPHYDICKSKRALAIANGAVEIDRYKVVEIIKKYRNGIK